MARPKKLQEIKITGDIKIPKSTFQTGFSGTIDDWGRIQTVGKEFAGCEFEIYVIPKKVDKVVCPKCGKLGPFSRENKDSNTYECLRCNTKFSVLTEWSDIYLT